MKNTLSDDLHEMLSRWEMEAVDRLRDGLLTSADTLRDCSDEVDRLMQRHACPSPRRPAYLRPTNSFRAARQDLLKLGLPLVAVGNPAADW